MSDETGIWMLARFLTAARRTGRLALIATLLGAATSARAADVDLSLAKLSPAPCPFQVDGRMSCGQLSVPENWSLGAASRRITVPFVRVAAAHPQPNRVPIAILTGGPGVTIFMGLGMMTATPLVDAEDAIFIEPRGYGYATPGLICNSVADLADCRQRWTAAGFDLSQYGVENAVRDFEALRRALKLGPWDVYGVSYGGVFALTEARLYPSGMRSMVLDSPAPPQVTYDGNRVSALNALQRMFDSCTSDARCNAAYPDLRNRFIAGFRKLNEHPLSSAGKSVSGEDAFEPLYHALYLTPSMPFAPKLADALAREDLSALKEASAAADAATAATLMPPKGFDYSRANALGLNAQMECAEIAPFPPDPEMAEALNAPWPKDIEKGVRPEGWDLGKRCAAWPTRPAAAIVHAAVESDIPALVLSGRFDPIVPLRMSEVTALHLSRATIMQDPSAAHMVIARHSPCIDRAIARFLADPAAVVDASCQAAIPPPAWVLPGRDPAKHE